MNKQETRIRKIKRPVERWRLVEALKLIIAECEVWQNGESDQMGGGDFLALIERVAREALVEQKS